MYPETEEDRVRYWQNQIAYSQQKAKPLFDACKILQNQYFNQATTDREETEGEELMKSIFGGLRVALSLVG